MTKPALLPGDWIKYVYSGGWGGGERCSSIGCVHSTTYKMAYVFLYDLKTSRVVERRVSKASIQKLNDEPEHTLPVRAIIKHFNDLVAAWRNGVSEP